MTMKAPLCHVTNPQLRDTEVGLPVASQLASLADSSDPGSRVFSALKKEKITPVICTTSHGEDAAHTIVFCIPFYRQLLFRRQCHSL